MTGPDWMVRGHSLAHDTRCCGVGKRLMSVPISARMSCSIAHWASMAGSIRIGLAPSVPALGSASASLQPVSTSAPESVPGPGSACSIPEVSSGSSVMSCSMRLDR